jgi:hypothetical protein
MKNVQGKICQWGVVIEYCEDTYPTFLSIEHLGIQA